MYAYKKPLAMSDLDSFQNLQQAILRVSECTGDPQHYNWCQEWDLLQLH